MCVRTPSSFVVRKDNSEEQGNRSFPEVMYDFSSCVKLIPKKRQALVEFDAVESAENLLDKCQVCISIFGQW